MDDLLHQVAKHLRAMWLHRWLGLIGTALVGLIGAIVVLQVPDKFEANARVYVDTQSILKPLMAGLAVQPNVEQQIDMLSRTLISRPNVEKLIRMADLDLKLKTPAEKEKLIDQVTKSLSIKSAGRDNLYTLSYRDRVPSVAQKVVQSLTTIFVESSLGSKREDSTTAKKFIDDQVAEYEKKLLEAETKVKEFKLRNLDVRVGEGAGAADRITQISEQLTQARMALSEAVNSRNALRRQIAEEKPFLSRSSGVDDSQIAVPEIDGRLQAQRNNLDALLQRFTELHPDVVQIRKQIRDLEQQRTNEIAARKRAAAANPSLITESNPVYQSAKISLGAAEANVASLQARVSEYNNQYAKAQAALRQSPELEAEFAQLNRDYNITKANYDQLVSRSESASLSGKLEAVGGIADFRVIDPPRVSNKPVEPNRILLMAGAFLASIGAGLFFSFAASQLRPVFFDARSLRDFSGLPVLGTVSMVADDAATQAARVNTKKFILAVGGLIAIYMVGLVVMQLLSGRG